jgi:hypothetical protein
MQSESGLPCRESRFSRIFSNKDPDRGRDYVRRFADMAETDECPECPIRGNETLRTVFGISIAERISRYAGLRKLPPKRLARS